MKSFAALLLFATVLVALAETPPAQKVARPAGADSFRIALFDDDPTPEWYPQMNPFNTMVFMYVENPPVLDHTGKPHEHGHVIQIIMDGGNGVQDPPNPDGSPSGDDSLAYGNYNMFRLTGLEDSVSLTGRSGQFATRRYFIPYSQLPRAYYLRLWEGDNVATAPYYQDTIEYSTGTDTGGTMLTMRENVPPYDVQWKFGPSKPRPKPAEPPKK